MKSLKSFLTFVILLFMSTGCALISDQPSGGNPPETKALSKEVGLNCFSEGDLACAGENYCGLKDDAQAGLRCCLVQFLDNYFSENTQVLGEMLGYEPLGFLEVRKMGRQEILEAKALPFGELFISSSEEAPGPTRLGAQWLKSLVAKDVSTQELRERTGKFGRDLEASFQCLSGVLSGFEGDEVQPEIFNSEEALSVSRRDLFFVKALLGAEAYLLQGISDYEWGFETFGQLKSINEFLADLNGKAGPEDDRAGDLDQMGAEHIAGRLKLLVQSFDALKSFSVLKGDPSRIDTYLNWRISPQSQKDASRVLKAAYQSLKEGKWIPIPDSDYEINLFSLSDPNTVPSGNGIPDDREVLYRNESREISLNMSFVRGFFSTVVRDRE